MFVKIKQNPLSPKELNKFLKFLLKIVDGYCLQILNYFGKVPIIHLKNIQVWWSQADMQAAFAAFFCQNEITFLYVALL